MKRAIAVLASFAACAALAQVPIYTRPTAASGAAIPSTITGGTNNSVLFVNPAATISQDNPNFTYTIGTTTLTAPIITSGTNFLGNDGTVGTPGFGWTNDNDGTGTGLYRRAANVVTFSTNGVATAEVAGTRFTMNSGLTVGWSSSATTVNAADTGISRTGAAAIAFGNGTAADTSAATSATNTNSSRFNATIGASPTVGGAACGTTGSVTGKDSAHIVTVGSGGTATTCVVTFSATWTNPPVCLAQNNTDRVSYTMATTATQYTITATAPFTAAGKFYVQCIGQ